MFGSFFFVINLAFGELHCAALQNERAHEQINFSAEKDLLLVWCMCVAGSKMAEAGG